MMRLAVHGMAEASRCSLEIVNHFDLITVYYL